MPPLLLIICRYAASILATMAKDEAGPLNGTVWPILIAVAVTPGPFCRSAAPALPESASRPTNSIRIIARDELLYRRHVLVIADAGRISFLSAARRKFLRNAIGILNSALHSAVASHTDVKAAVDAEMLAGGIGRRIRQQKT